MMLENFPQLVYMQDALTKSDLTDKELQSMMKMILNIKDDYDSLTSDEIQKKQLHELKLIQNANEKIRIYKEKQYEKERKAREREEKWENFFNNIKSFFFTKRKNPELTYDSTSKTTDKRLEILYAINNEINKL